MISIKEIQKRLELINIEKIKQLALALQSCAFIIAAICAGIWTIHQFYVRLHNEEKTAIKGDMNIRNIPAYDSDSEEEGTENNNFNIIKDKKIIVDITLENIGSKDINIHVSEATLQVFHLKDKIQSGSNLETTTYGQYIYKPYGDGDKTSNKPKIFVKDDETSNHYRSNDEELTHYRSRPLINGEKDTYSFLVNLQKSGDYLFHYEVCITKYNQEFPRNNSTKKLPSECKDFDRSLSLYPVQKYISVQEASVLSGLK